MNLTYLGYSAFKFESENICLYIDPYFKEPVNWRSLPKGDVVFFTHGHFDHGVLSAVELFEAWKCNFYGPAKLMNWMAKKFRRKIPAQHFIAIDHGEKLKLGKLEILATPAHHPTTRLGKTWHAIFSRSAAPGHPVNGYYFDGYYHSGDTLYSPIIAASLAGKKIHTACLPIGGKYKVASPIEALKIAEEIKAFRLVPMHWQPLVEQMPFKYQPSHLVKLARDTKTKVEVCPLAIGEVLELKPEYKAFV